MLIRVFILLFFWGIKVLCWHVVLPTYWSWWLYLSPLQMPGITWAMPTPIADTVSPSASLCSEPLMINWERITDRLRMAFPQQTRYFDFSLVVTLVFCCCCCFTIFIALIVEMKHLTYTHKYNYFFYHGLSKIKLTKKA